MHAPRNVLLLWTLVSLLPWLASPAGLYAAPAPVIEAANLANRGEYEKAATIFSGAVKQDPKNASLRLSLGLVYQSLERFPEAIRELERSIKLSPSLLGAHRSLALLYEAAAVKPEILKGKGKGKPVKYWRKAKRAWKKVLRLSNDPKDKKLAKQHLARIAEELSDGR